MRGRLLQPADAPATGERTAEIARVGAVVVEQIVSGALGGPVDYLQGHDEWVVVLDGGATLQIGGERVDLEAGDWVLLPARTPHTLVEARPGTSWLALHGPDT